MPVLVVELARQQRADLALAHVRDPRRNQLDGAELVVHALAHPVADLLESNRRWRARLQPHVATAPERRVVRGERGNEIARGGHGALNRMLPIIASDVLCVSLESMDSESTAGSSGASP